MNRVHNLVSHLVTCDHTDGIETGNTFFRNLGAFIRASEIGPADIDSDATKPSIFWITNPSNLFDENVAAGSEDSGFWFDLRLRGPYADSYPFDPFYMELTSFRDNVAHSTNEVSPAYL